MSKNLKCGVVSEVQCKWFTEASGCGIPEGEECTVERYPNIGIVKAPRFDYGILLCTNCGFKVDLHDNFCKHCGIRMKRILEE